MQRCARMAARAAQYHKGMISIPTGKGADRNSDVRVGVRVVDDSDTRGGADEARWKRQASSIGASRRDHLTSGYGASTQ